MNDKKYDVRDSFGISEALKLAETLSEEEKKKREKEAKTRLKMHSKKK